MANTFPNVRFYKLEVLPSFDAAKHTGIFVHVTGTMRKSPWTLVDGKTRINPEELFMTVLIDGKEKINLVQWLVNRNIETVESGLWFGGANGWELLSNDTSSGAIDAAIAALDVDGYSQAEITDDGINSSLTIKGIKEENGKIGADTNKNVSVEIDGVYNSSTNKIATVGTVTSKINALDVSTITTVTKTASGDNTILGFKGVKETDGKIAQGDSNETFTVGDAKLKLVVGTEELEIFSANAKSDSELQLDSNAFQWNKSDDKFILGVKTKTAITDKNRLITESDIAGIAGAMHYIGSIANDNGWPSTTPKKGDVYISTGTFTHGGETIQTGDMIVFGDNGSFTVVQSNITLGTGSGQVAANSAALTSGNLVVASATGIETISFDATNLTDTNKNTRNLTQTNGRHDAEIVANGVNNLYHAVTVTDTLKIMNRDFTESLDIWSENRSIQVDAENGVKLDLVWNTVME